MREAPLDLAHELHAVHPRHVQIGDHDIPFLPVEDAQGIPRVRREQDVMAGTRQDAAHRAPEQGIIIDDENACHHVPAPPPGGGYGHPAPRSNQTLGVAAQAHLTSRLPCGADIRYAERIDTDRPGAPP